MNQEDNLDTFSKDVIDSHLKGVISALDKPLKNRQQTGMIRKLTPSVLDHHLTDDNLKNTMNDFSSNDYLGLSDINSVLQLNLRRYLKSLNYIDGPSLSGSTGSRLLDGNYIWLEELENKIAAYHGFDNGLLFNSGFDANVSLFSCIANKQDVIIYDEYIHASTHDGLRLSKTKNKIMFKHNDLSHLGELLRILRTKNKGNLIFIAIEAIYSMDGDFSNVKRIVYLCLKYNALLIIDEAHSTGIYGEEGMGWTIQNINKEIINKVIFACVVTYGKAFCASGAIILGSEKLKQYLINYSRPLIYSTALSPLQCKVIELVYKVIKNPLEGQILREKLRKNIEIYKRLVNQHLPKERIIDSHSHIQLIKIPGNHDALLIASFLQKNKCLVRAIRYPTVPKGQERIRICLRATHNEHVLLKLILLVKEFLKNNEKLLNKL